METTKLTSLEQLKKLAARAKTEMDNLKAQIADTAIPTKVSELTNDSNYQTDTQVNTSIQTAISQAGHATFQVAEAVPAAENAQENVLYLVMNEATNHYDIYAKVGQDVVLLDDTTVDLSGMLDTEDVASDTEVEAMLDEVFGTAAGA